MNSPPIAASNSLGSYPDYATCVCVTLARSLPYAHRLGKISRRFPDDNEIYPGGGGWDFLPSFFPVFSSFSEYSWILLLYFVLIYTVEAVWTAE